MVRFRGLYMAFVFLVAPFFLYAQPERMSLRQALLELGEKYDRSINYVDDALFDQSVYVPVSGTFQKRLEILTSQVPISIDRLEDKGIMLIKRPEASTKSIVSYYSIRGVVKENTGQVLPFCHVYLEQGTQGTYADANGRFLLDGLPSGRNSVLRFSAIGFEGKSLVVNETITEALEVKLNSRFMELEAVEVTTGSYLLNEERPVSQYSLSKKQIDYSPNLIQDVFRTINAVPSISNSDYSVKPQIRGGNFTETAIYLDGFELINPFHVEISGGVQGLFNTDYVEQVKILPGTFSALYTDKLSGVVDLTTSNFMDDNEVTFSLDLLNAIASGKFKVNDNLQFFTSFRRGYWDLLIDLDALGASLVFYDTWNKFVYQPNDNNVFEFSLLYGKDKFGYSNDNNNIEILNYDSDLDKVYAWLNWKTYFSPDYFSRTTIGFQHLNRTSDFLFESSQSPNNRDDAAFSQFSINQYLEQDLNDDLHLSYGVEYRYFENDLRFSETRYDVHQSTANSPQLLNLDIAERLDGHLFGAYGEVTHQASKRLTWKGGIRLSGQSFVDKLQVAPRTNVNFQISDQISTGLGYGWFFQPDNYFDPATELGQKTLDDQSSKAIHYSWNFTYSPKNSVFRLDAFYKDYHRLRDDFRLTPTSRIESFKTFEESFQAVSGNSMGLEFSLNHKYGPHNVNVVYAYSRNRMENAVGESTARYFDIPHQFSINNLLQFKGNITLSTSFVWRSGLPYSPINAVTGIVKAGDNDEVLFYQLGNNFSLRQHRYTTLDLRFSKKWIKQKANWEVYFNLLNTLNADNVRNFYYRGSIDGNRNVVATRDTNRYFPFFVTPGLKVTF